MKTGLVIVDVQNDYFPGGTMELVGMEVAAANVAQLLARFRADNAPRYHVQHLSNRPGATFFLPGTPGAEIHPAARPSAGEVLVQKHFPNAFRDTPLLQALRDDGVRHVVICGAMSHMCIDATTRAAFDFGLKCTVVSDACATRDLRFGGERIAAKDVHAAFMAALSVPFAGVLDTRDFLATPAAQ